MEEKEKPQPAKWPFDPMQPGDHEPVRPTEDETVETERPELHSGGDRRRAC
jgi:hypothetical protein